MNQCLRFLNRDSRSTTARNHYYKSRKSYRSTIKRKKQTFTSNLNKDIENSNLKSLNWPALKKLQKLNEEATSFDEFDIESFYNFFKHLYSLKSVINPDHCSLLLNNAALENERLTSNMSDTLESLNKDISLDEIITTIKQLSNGKSVSLDLVSNEMLKNLDSNMLKIIAKLFNACLHQGTYPWNVSTITPILKGGDPYNRVRPFL